MNKFKISYFAFLISLALVQMGNTSKFTTEIPAVYKKIYGAMSITSDGEYLTIKANGLPNHKSIYYNRADQHHFAPLE